MLMLSLFRFAATMIRWSLNLAIWALARAFNLPEPLVHGTGVFISRRRRRSRTGSARRCARCGWCVSSGRCCSAD